MLKTSENQLSFSKFDPQDKLIFEILSYSHSFINYLINRGSVKAYHMPDTKGININRFIQTLSAYYVPNKVHDKAVNEQVYLPLDFYFNLQSLSLRNSA